MYCAVYITWKWHCLISKIIISWTLYPIHPNHPSSSSRAIAKDELSIKQHFVQSIIYVWEHNFLFNLWISETICIRILCTLECEYVEKFLLFNYCCLNTPTHTHILHPSYQVFIIYSNWKHNEILPKGRRARVWKRSLVIIKDAGTWKL